MRKHGIKTDSTVLYFNGSEQLDNSVKEHANSSTALFDVEMNLLYFDINTIPSTNGTDLIKR